MRILLFGATGFLGRRIERALRAEPERVDLLTVCRSSALVYLDSTGRARPITSMRMDLASCSDDDLTRLLRAVAPDVVVNTIGCTVGSAVELARANHFAVVRLVAAMERVLPGARLVHLASSAEYGPGQFRQHSHETDPCTPDAAYGRTMLIGTSEVRRAAAEGSLDAIVLRVFDAVGFGSGPGSFAGKVARLVRRAALTGDVEVELPPLDGYHDFVDADDVAAAVVAACRLRDVPRLPGGPVVNIGSGVPIMGRSFAQIVADHAGYRGRLIGAPERAGAMTTAAAYATVSWLVADTRRAAAVLGWAPRRLLPHSVGQLWESLGDHAPLRAREDGAAPLGVPGSGTGGDRPIRTNR